MRVHRGRTKRELARDAGVSDSAVSRIERGRLDGVTVGTLQQVSVALDARLDLVVQWHGGELARLLNRRHSLLHESVARWFAGRRSVASFLTNARPMNARRMVAPLRRAAPCRKR